MLGVIVRVVVATSAGTLVPAAALAEVADKVAAPSAFWFEGVALACLVLLLARRSIWLCLIPLAIAVFLWSGVWDMYQDAHFGPALRAEVGSSYLIHASLAHSLPGVALLWAFASRALRHRRARSDDA